ncbi:MAG: PIN domain-containing protein [Planctomycetes bacterium]|nr:PIN domain-containing protein [Planctomycetota bacterium]
MIIIDTGPLVALFDKSDKYHKICKKTLRNICEPITTTWPVLTEVMYLLNFSSAAQEICFEFIESGGVDVQTVDTNHLHRIRQLMKHYADLPMDFADASLVALAEEKKVSTIFTIDHRDFRIYVPKHSKSFRIIPKTKSG